MRAEYVDMAKLYSGGMGINEICERMKCGYVDVVEALRSFGIEINDFNNLNILQKPKFIPEKITVPVRNGSDKVIGKKEYYDYTDLFLNTSKYM